LLAVKHAQSGLRLPILGIQCNRRFQLLLSICVLAGLQA
jgi:hypothetical protein